MLDLDEFIDAFAARQVEGERPWEPPADPSSFDEGFFYLGAGNPPLEVLVVPVDGRPRRDQVRNLWRERQGRQASPLLLVVPFRRDGSTDAHLCGPTDADLTVRELAFEQAVGLAASALSEPSGQAAIRFLHEQTPKEGQEFQGLINQGMFAAHTLQGRVRDMPEWAAAAEHGDALRTQEGRELVGALGYTIETTNTPVHVLRAPNQQARAVAVFLDRDEGPETEGGRFGDSSALSQAFTRAERDNIPFVLFTRGPEIRLYAVFGYEGVGRKGQAETYVQANVSLLGDDETGFLPLIFGAEALMDGGSFGRILDWSRNFSADLSARLRERVYVRVVPELAVAVGTEHAHHDPDADRSLDDIYEETLVILFRLLFLAYAEDRELLPYAASAEYRRNSLKTLSRSLAARANDGKGWDGVRTTSLWTDVGQLFEAVDKSNDAWSVPAYNGGLFSPDPRVSQAGGAIAQLKLTDERFGPPLTALLTEPGDDGVVGPVDFRSLSVRDFGTIYEGLLESSLSVATENLTLDTKAHFVPAKAGEPIEVSAGDIYFHNRSGARKSTGSYFTKDFAVEHLLDRALEPALADHLERLAKSMGDRREDEAGVALFDFRCADLAMGSGHFLVAAVDRIERRLAQFLDEHPIAAVDAELDRLRAAAVDHLGDTAAGYEIERRQLLRRQVARRCVYGVDRNHIAVELARLSLWVHTFVPGLPLSFLDHNLVEGDSLTGVGTIDEAVGFLTEQTAGKQEQHGQVSIFESLIVDWLSKAKEPLMRLARASDATRSELRDVRAAQDEARGRAEPVRRLFDLVGAMRRGEAAPLPMGVETEAILQHPDLAQAEHWSEVFLALHFPSVFPEVFLRERPGFDCIVGNPPWDKVRFEPTQFWVTRDPGLQSLTEPAQKKRISALRVARPLETALEEQERHDRDALQHHFKAAYHEQGTGHLDLSKLFVERVVALSRDDGRLGLVLPRQALVLGGWSKLRRLVLSGSRIEAFQARNRGGWFFEGVEHRYMVVLLVRTPTADSRTGEASVWPAATDVATLRSESAEQSLELDSQAIAELSDSAMLPWFDETQSTPIFTAMAEQPRLGQANGWIQAFNDTRWDFSGSGRHSKHRSAEASEGGWRVLMTRHVHQYRVDRGGAGFRRFIDDPASLVELNLGVELSGDRAHLGTGHPALVVRFPSRNDDARTVIVGALADDGELYSAGYAHGIRHAPGTDTPRILALLAYLNSYTCDWWARRFVDRHVTAPIVNGLPLPDWDANQIEKASLMSATLLRRGGTNVIAGGRSVPNTAMFDQDTDAELKARVETLVLAGFGMGTAEIAIVLEDFSERGAPAELRRVLEAGS